MAAAKRAFGRDGVEPRPDGVFLLTSPVSKGWAARTKRTQTVAEHPGTAVRWDGELYEVLEALPLPEGGMRYRLAPWEDRHAIRVIETYDAPAEAARVRERADRAASVRKRRLSILFAPLLGHLPGHVQERMEREFGAPARAMTIASALPLLVLGFLSAFAFLVAAFGSRLLPRGTGSDASPAGVFGAWPILPLPLAFYLVLESGARCGVAFLQDRPMGSLPGVLLYEIWGALRGRRPAAAPAARRTEEPLGDQSLEDRFRMLEVLLALLTPEEQELLERRFGFDPLKWGRITAVVLLTIGGLNLFAALVNIASGAGTLWDVLWLVCGGYLFVEQLQRRKRLARGLPAGSVLGGIVRPLARGLLMTGQGKS